VRRLRRAGSSEPSGQDLTWRQRRIVHVITESVQRHGYGPTRREIGRAVGLASTSSVSYQLSRLEEKGYLSRGAGRSRAIVLRFPGDPAIRENTGRDHSGRVREAAPERGIAPVPLVGRIAAGPQILATELDADIIPLPRQLVGEGEFIVLRVAGDSMIGAAIADGDLVVVRTESDAENGDIVAAMIESETSDDGEATVKTLRKRDGHVWLVPHNPSYEPIMGDAAEIIGKVVAVLRRL
jgi:repressor LexA